MSYFSYDRRVRTHLVHIDGVFCFKDLYRAVDAAWSQAVNDDLDLDTVEVSVTSDDEHTVLCITINSVPEGI